MLHSALGSLKITGRKDYAKNRRLRTIAQLCQAISLQLSHVSTVGEKNLLNNNMSFTCAQSMVKVSPLTAEIGSGVWGTPGNFNRFHVLASLCIQVLRSPIFAALLHGT